MDLIAFFIAVLGTMMACNGYLLVGIALVTGPLAALAFLIERGQKPWLLLPFTFASWFVVLPLAFLATFALRSQGLYPFPLGVALYYYGCVALRERNARYVPWGGGFGWRNATRIERPVIYWLVISLAFTMCVILLALALASVSGLLPSRVSGRQDR